MFIDYNGNLHYLDIIIDYFHLLLKLVYDGNSIIVTISHGQLDQYTRKPFYSWYMLGLLLHHASPDQKTFGADGLRKCTG
jgi:hypothetical protein